MFQFSQDHSLHIDTSPYLRSLRDTKLFADLEIRIGARKILAHQAILASEYFDSLLVYSQPGEILMLEDVDPDLFEGLLDLIYGKDVPIQGLRTVRLLTLAVYFDVIGINFNEIIPKIIVEKREVLELRQLVNQVYPKGVPQVILEHLQFLERD